MNNVFSPCNDPGILHYGMPRKSGRYPWGSGDRPRQSLEGGRKKIFQKKQKENKQKMSKKKMEIAKERAIKSGSAKDVLKYKDQMSNKELEEALNRINITRKLNEYSEKDYSKEWDRIDKTMNRIKTVNGWASTALSTYKNAKEIKTIIDDLSKKYK